MVTAGNLRRTSFAPSLAVLVHRRLSSRCIRAPDWLEEGRYPDLRGPLALSNEFQVGPHPPRPLSPAEESRLGHADRTAEFDDPPGLPGLASRRPGQRPPARSRPTSRALIATPLHRIGQAHARRGRVGYCRLAPIAYRADLDLQGKPSRLARSRMGASILARRGLRGCPRIPRKQ